MDPKILQAAATAIINGEGQLPEERPQIGSRLKNLLPKNRPIANIWTDDFQWNDIYPKDILFLNKWRGMVPDVKTGIYLHGIAGSGKTTVAVNMGMCWDRKCNYKTRAYDWIDLIKAIKTLPDYRSQEEFAMIYNLEKGQTKSLIIFDDFGAGKYTENVIETTENIIRRLEKVGAICIFTSNVTPEKIVEIYSEQVWSRICGMTVQIELGGRDWRVR